MANGAGRLSDDDLALFGRLLGRYCEFDLDQFDNWIVATSHGDVFVTLTRQDPPEDHMTAYRRIPT
ncbi:hypothetical protein [Lentzea sp. NPDC060358]|uniref:hypothetical protein n=1 Tax=Lentzea sp. NPDC060358 TaxID=3347103 RepID=UPI00365931C7